MELVFDLVRLMALVVTGCFAFSVLREGKPRVLAFGGGVLFAANLMSFGLGGTHDAKLIEAMLHVGAMCILLWFMLCHPAVNIVSEIKDDPWYGLNRRSPRAGQVKWVRK